MRNLFISLIVFLFVFYSTSCSVDDPPKTGNSSHKRPIIIVKPGNPVSFKISGDGNLVRLMVNEVRRDQMKIGETGVSSIWGIIAADFKSTPPVSDVQEITYPVIPDKYRLMPIIKEEAPPLVEGKYYQVEILTESKGVSTFSDSVEVDFQILNGQIKTFRRVCKFRENGQPVIKECSPGCPDDVEVEGQLMQYACGSSGD